MLVYDAAIGPYDKEFSTLSYGHLFCMAHSLWLKKQILFYKLNLVNTQCFHEFSNDKLWSANDEWLQSVKIMLITS